MSKFPASDLHVSDIDLLSKAGWSGSSQMRSDLCLRCVCSLVLC